MPRPHPHPLALLSLQPLNEPAEEVLAHPLNEPFVSRLKNGRLALDIGHIRSKSGTGTLATLGRGDADIFVPGSRISKVQCSFELDLDTKIVMLYDRSHGQTTQVFGENATPFEDGRVRKIVVRERLNTILGMGGEKRNLIQFVLEWHDKGSGRMEKANGQENIVFGYEENPRFARTVVEADTALPSRRETRLHTAGFRQLTMRYVKLDPLGSGQYGAVYRAIDVDSGKFMAVKIIQRPVNAKKQQLEHWRQSVHYALKREVENLANINHPHIVDYIASQGWDGPVMEIFMGLKNGTLESFIESGDRQPVADSVFHHILQALDFLALNDIVHRDVKPENILYVTGPNNQLQFQLGDFGLSNRVVNANTLVGSPLYMAPEMFQKGEQTHKIDVWSFFVTMLWTLDVRGFRQNAKHFKSPNDAHEEILSIASKEKVVSKIREMAILTPVMRASAAQMLIKCFDGAGLSTHRSRVPALNNVPAVAAAKALPGGVPVWTTRTVQQKPRGSQKNGVPTSATGRNRVEKTRQILQGQLRKQAFHPSTKKRLAPAITPPPVEHLQIPGSFPSIDNKAIEGRNQLQRMA